MNSPCTICSDISQPVFTHRILNKYDCQYYLCPSCGLLQTEKPYWLDEAYASSIALADTGILQRNIKTACQLSKLLYLAFDKQGRYADIAGGYGLLVRLMRDKGYDFFWHDPYTENIHARGFEAELSGQTTYEAVTAFEVLEHLRNPMDFISNALHAANTRTIIMSTELFAGKPPQPDHWWYYSFATGQHIAFYQLKTLDFLAGRLGLTLFSHKNLHIMTDRKLRPAMLKLALSSRTDWLIHHCMKKNLASKTRADHDRLLLR